VLAGALTLALLILPVVIIAAQEAIRAVPSSLREASYGLGATRWQTIRHHVLPVAMPGILTGTILALSRAIGETAPLIMIGALTFIAFDPTSPLDSFTVLPIQIYNWVSLPREEFQHLAAGGIVVLLASLLLMNATAILLRNKYRNQL
jgi:phosphate transport system permease protein